MKKYNLYMFNDGDVVASTNSIEYFPEYNDPVQIASGLTRDEAWHIENMLTNDGILYTMIEKLVSEVDKLNKLVKLIKKINL